MLTLDHPGIYIWRSQPENRSIPDQNIIGAINIASRWADDHARPNSTAGARDAIALFRLRWIFSEEVSERRMLMDAVSMLTGEC